MDCEIRDTIMSLARDRLFRRLEKVLVTIESMLVGVFIGVCTGVIVSEAVFGAIVAGCVFVPVVVYKRRKIREERE